MHDRGRKRAMGSSLPQYLQFNEFQKTWTYCTSSVRNVVSARVVVSTNCRSLYNLHKQEGCTKLVYICYYVNDRCFTMVLDGIMLHWEVIKTTVHGPVTIWTIRITWCVLLVSFKQQVPYPPIRFGPVTKGKTRKTENSEPYIRLMDLTDYVSSLRTSRQKMVHLVSSTSKIRISFSFFFSSVLLSSSQYISLGVVYNPRELGK